VAVAARCLLHVVYEFQSFINLYAQKVLSISPGAAAQVNTPHPSRRVRAGSSCGRCLRLCHVQMMSTLKHPACRVPPSVALPLRA